MPRPNWNSGQVSSWGVDRTRFISVAQIDGNTMHIAESGLNRTPFPPASIGLNPSISAYVEYELFLPLLDGTYSLVTSGNKANNRGIATFLTSSDGSSWASLTTVDQYQVSQGWATNVVTGLTISGNPKFLRIETPTKNALSSNYQVYLSGVGLRRTGA